jgi:hypothetical protein
MADTGRHTRQFPHHDAEYTSDEVVMMMKLRATTHEALEGI